MSQPEKIIEGGQGRTPEELEDNGLIFGAVLMAALLFIALATLGGCAATRPLYGF